MKFKHNKHWRWYVNRNIMSQKIDMYWMGEGVNGKSYFRRFKEIEEICVEEGEILNPDTPTLMLDYEEADTLMQEMWEAGIRPKDVQTGQAHVDALHKHIESLQKTVEHFMDVNSLPSMMEIEVPEMTKLQSIADPSPFDKLSMDFNTLWKKVQTMSDTLSGLTDSMKKTTELLQKASNKI